MPLSTYFFTFEYKMESQKEGQRTLLRCSGLFSIDCFFVWRASAFKRIQSHAVLTALRRLLHAAP